METNRKDEIWNECFPKCSTLRETWRLAMEQYAIEYHEQQVKKCSLHNVSNNEVAVCSCRPINSYYNFELEENKCSTCEKPIRAN